MFNIIKNKIDVNYPGEFVNKEVHIDWIFRNKRMEITIPDSQNIFMFISFWTGVVAQIIIISCIDSLV